MLKSVINSRRSIAIYQKTPVMKFWAVFLCAFVSFPMNTKSLFNQQVINRVHRDTSCGMMSESSQLVKVKDQSSPIEISAAELVAKASTFQEVMVAVDSLVYPGEEKLHYQTQAVHQRKRQKVASNALKRLVKFLVGVSMNQERQQLVESEKFYRLCVCATSAMTEKLSEKDNAASYWLNRADVTTYLESLYALGALAPLPQNIIENAINPLLEQLNKINVERDRNSKDTIEVLPFNLKLKPTEISGLEWCINRMKMRESKSVSDTDTANQMIDNDPAGNNQILVASVPVELNSIIATKNIISSREKLELPFLILHGLVKGITTVEEMRRMVPFKAEMLTTKDGKTVSERRETCWMADEGIGGLAYSGKIMTPVPFTNNVALVRDAIERATGIYYDCCLINWYDDGECACKMHSDPDHGRLWAHDTVVVSIGETRRFNLREIPNNVVPTFNSNSNSNNALNKSVKKDLSVKPQGGGKNTESEQDHHSFHLYDGDVFYMTDGCQDTYQHCVMKSEGDTNNSPRSSIVFKKSLPGLGGKRGHGLVKTKNTDIKKSVPEKKIDTKKGILSTAQKNVRADSMVKVPKQKQSVVKNKSTGSVVGVKQKK